MRAVAGRISGLAALRLAAALPPLTLAGCTTIELRAAPDQVRIERCFGFANVEIRPSSAPVMARMRTFGASSSPLGFNIGYAREEIAALPDGCRVVFWAEDAQQVRTFREFFADVEDVCAVRAE